MNISGEISSRRSAIVCSLRRVGAVILVASTLLFHAPQTMAYSAPANANIGYTQWMNSFIPQGVSTVHWTENRTSYRKVGTTTRSSSDKLEGWYKAADHFRHDYPSNWAVQNGREVLWYTKGNNTYHKTSRTPLSELEYFYRPDQFGCCGFYTQADLTGSKETAGNYKGTPCTIIELDYKAKTSTSADGPCRVISGPTQILVYFDPNTRRQLARETREMDGTGQGLTRDNLRTFTYDLPLGDNLFTCVPPAGATIQNLTTGTPEKTDQYAQWADNFIPRNIGSVQYNEYDTYYAKPGTRVRGYTRQYTGLYKADDHFRWETPELLSIQNNKTGWWYWKRDNSYKEVTWSSHFCLEYFFRPDRFGEGAYYSEQDIAGGNEKTADYKGTMCRLIEMDYKATSVRGVHVGPTQILIYLDNSGRQLMREITTWDDDGQTLVSKRIRQFIYDINIDDNYFTFIPPAGAHPR